MIRRFTNSRPVLTLALVMLWTIHFSFGMFLHYHPDYVHAHEGELQAHSHGGHFHSLELEQMARFIDSGEAPLPPGETHHHSESLPGGDNQSVQYDFNKAGITKVKSVLDFDQSAAVVFHLPADLYYAYHQPVVPDPDRHLWLPHAFIERSPPLRV